MCVRFDHSAYYSIYEVPDEMKRPLEKALMRFKGMRRADVVEALSVRTRNCLKSIGLTDQSTRDDVSALWPRLVRGARYTNQDHIRNFGKVCLREIAEWLSDGGINVRSL